jgi:ABC-type transport system substrate-binding protein
MAGSTFLDKWTRIMINRRLLDRINILIISFLLLASCDLSPNEKEIRQGLYLFPAGLDPARNFKLFEYQIFSQIYEPLLRLDNDYQTLLPCLAETWSISENNLVYTFQLRPDVPFHDGSILTAEAARFSFMRQIQLRPEPEYPLFSIIDTIRSTGPLTLQIELKHPYLPFLYSLASPTGLMVVSQNALEKYGKDIDKNPVGTGPFYLDKWPEDKTISLYAFKGYREKSMIDKVSFILPDTASQTEILFRDGELDVLHMVAGLWLNRLKWLGIVEYYVQKPLNSIYLGFNLKNDPVNNIKIRQAILAAIDIEKLVYISNRGNALPAYGPIPPIYDGFEDLRQMNYNPELSIKLLKESGYDNGLSLNLNIFLPTYSRQIKIEMLKSQLNKVGITLNTDFYYDWDLFTASLKDQDCHLFNGGYGSELIGDPGNFLYALFHSTSSNNRSNYHNGEVDSFLEQAFLETNSQKRQEMYRSIVKTVLKDTPAVFDSYVKSIFAYNPKKIKSLMVNPYEYIYFHRLEIYE